VNKSTPLGDDGRLDLYSIVLIAMGLAMDAFSVATVTGSILKRVNLSQASKMSSSFGLFHVVMPVIGWYMGSTIVLWIADYDHWLAFLLLAFVGGRMIYDAVKATRRTEGLEMVSGLNLLFFSVAVSIDALAVGLTFSLENVAILLPVLLTGFTAALFTIIGLVVGSKTGRLFGRNMEIIGGSLLIAIGLRIVVTHML
jgi:putative Mn2+ efflux pump MntP